MKHLLALLALATAAFSQAIVPSNHVFVLMLENRSDAEALRYMPYLSNLAAQNGTAAQAYSASHGSWLAYGELVGGINPIGGEALNKVCNGDGCKHTIDVPNLVRQLDAEGKTWKGYFQSIPSTGFMGRQSGQYLRRHNPYPFFSDVANSHSEQQNMVQDTELAADLAAHTVANYNWISPDANHDGHNGGTQAALTAADHYLQAFLPQLLESSYFQPGGDGVLIVTFDESDLSGDNQCGNGRNKCGGHIFTAVIGPNVKPAFTSNTVYVQKDMLATTCALLQLSACPGDGATGKSMAEFFRSAPPPPPPPPPVTFELETLAHTTIGANLENMLYAGFPDGVGLKFASTAVGNSATFVVNATTAGNYDLQVSGKVFSSRGTFQVSVNGVDVGSPIDEYGTVAFKAYDLGTTALQAGANTMTFTVVGKNPLSNQYWLALDFITLTPR